MGNVNYKILKSNIIKACKQVKEDSIEFRIMHNKLVDLVSDNNLYPINVGMHCRSVDPEIIPFISEYFEKNRLSWFTEGKFYTNLVFVDIENLSQEEINILTDTCTTNVEDPDYDKTHAVADIVAKYPCYFATVVSYKNNDPNNIGKPFYEIVCRANKIVIKSTAYKYNPADMS